MKELNAIVSKSFDKDHFYFKPRISFEEFLNLSNNIITTSACLASPLNIENTERIKKILEENGSYEDIEYQKYIYEQLCKKYDYLEVQPHINSEEQKEFNLQIVELSKKYNKPIVCGTDTHSSTQYKAECRKILKVAKRMDYAKEDDFDLTYKTYDEIVDMFKKQNVLSEEQYLSAIENTNRISDSIENIEIDTSIKYPKMYDNDEEYFINKVYKMFDDKLKSGIIPISEKSQFEQNIKEEIRVFKKTNMCGFMLSMSEIICWCKEHNISTGFGRGSCCGSSVAYVTDIIDVNPVKWKTVFSRFCNEDRVEVGDIDTDIFKPDRQSVYDYIIERFGKDKTAYVLALGTISDKGTIDDIGRALDINWKKQHDGNENTKYSLKNIARIKEDFDKNPEECKGNNKDIFYYFDGLVNTCVSQSMHPAGMVVSPITVQDNYGTLENSGLTIAQLDMDCIHDMGGVKYDILGLRNVGIIDRTCRYIGTHFPKSNEINWNDENVWDSMKKCPVGIFQFEEEYAFSMLKKFNTNSIEDMSLVTAAIRPSGGSYRNDLIERKIHKNPSTIIDDMLKENLGYLVYQEDTIKFLKDICGLSGSDADNVRRAIGHKDIDRLQKALPQIMDGYCSKSNKPRTEAEEEAKEFLKVIEDSASYQFGYNHSVAYCMLGYACAYYRYYYPLQFLTAFFNCSDTESDFTNGNELAKILKIKIVEPKFRHSKSEYFFDLDSNCIYKGIKSVKYLNSNVADVLYSLRENKYDNFIQLLYDIKNTGIDSRQIQVLIKLDFFSEFGNAKKLMRIYNIFTFFKSGEAKSIFKAKVTDTITSSIISRHSTETEKKYNNLDCSSILNEMCQYIDTQDIEDFDYKIKIQDELEYLGYISLKTEKTEDRPKLIILDKKNMISKFGKDMGKPWAVNIQAQSIGSGIKNEFTIMYSEYKKCPFEKDDVILVDPRCVEKNNKGYWYIKKYEKVI